MSGKKYIFLAEEQDLGSRLDKILVKHFPDRTRQYFQKLLQEGHVLVNDKKIKASFSLKVGNKVGIYFPEAKSLKLSAKDIPLDIVYEDKDLLVINKPAGMVVHPGTHDSHSEDSLVNAVLYHCKGKLGAIGGVLRPGIVHRLDKDTSGLLLVAKNDQAHQFLASQFKNREVTKVYYALVVGHLTPTKGTIEAPIGRDPHDRKKMSVTTSREAKMSVTQYKVLHYYGDYTYVEVALLTGRTHQIRVHFSSIGFPLVGDSDYGRSKVNDYFREQFGLDRQFLHAGMIGFSLPSTQKKVEFNSTLPSDLKNVLDGLAS